MSDGTTAVPAIPRALESSPSGADRTLAADLAMRVQIEPFNVIATGVFVLAILHTFGAARFARSRTPDSYRRTRTSGPVRTKKEPSKRIRDVRNQDGSLA